MPMSMTGYGRAESTIEGFSFSIEVKTLNHRYLEQNIRISREFMLFEERIRRFVQEYISRGKVDVFVGIERVAKKKNLKLNEDILDEYLTILEQIAEKTGFDLKKADPFRLMQVNDIVQAETESEDIEFIWNGLKDTLCSAKNVLLEMRLNEGERIVEDVVYHIGIVKELAAEISAQSSGLLEIYKEKLKEKIAKISADHEIDQQRLSVETVLFADKSDITEELTRLASHMVELEKVLRENVPIGRKIDFIIQEINREVNTIGSKANSYIISSKVVDIKVELEKIREQIQNIE